MTTKPKAYDAPCKCGHDCGNGPQRAHIPCENRLNNPRVLIETYQHAPRSFGYRIINGRQEFGGAEGFKSESLAMIAGVERMREEMAEGLLNPFAKEVR